MCGLAGWVAAASTTPPDSALKSMIDALAHRGPDGDGAYFTQTRDGAHRIALGHRRLAIIDLAGGNQPMADESDDLIVTFNGEIYNYRELQATLAGAGHIFRTRSDTEVLLAGYKHWGDEFISRLRGMFAFAIWDRRRERLFMARDRFGEKPLFIMPLPGGISFASELKALLTLPDAARRLDMAALAAFLTYRWVPAPATLFQGLTKLLPGHCAEWQAGKVRQWRYYAPPDTQPRIDGPPPRAPIGDFLALLDEAVHLCTVSDVPYGAFLSGGIDSSAIVALMARRSSHPVSTFSVGFEEAAYSELNYAAAVARSCSTRHHELVVTQSDVMNDLPKLTRMRDAPVGEPSDIPIYRLSVEASRCVKMVLTGEGSDEVMAGYPRHVFERFARGYQRLVSPPVHRAFVASFLDRLPYSQRRLQILGASFGVRDEKERMARWVGALVRDEQAELSPLPIPPPLDLGIEKHENSALRKILAFDQSSWLPDNLLERGDRMTMAASIEARLPFLDAKLVDFVSRLPDRYRVRGFTTKSILRDAMKSILPPEILSRPKVGFRVPTNEWFRREWRDHVLDALTGPKSLTREFFSTGPLTKMLTDHISGRRNHEKLIWTLFTLEVFQREFRLSPG